jgi:hypothetical protein
MLPRCAYVRLAEGRYAAAAAVAREGSTRALAANDAFGRMVCQFYGVWAELLQGSWGGADELLAESLQLAERNGHRSWEMLFAALRAWLLREAGAPAEARRAAWQAVQDRARIRRAVRGTDRGDAAGAGECSTSTTPGGALEILEGLDARLEREPMLMAAAWRMPIHIGTSAAHRRLKAWTKAEDERERARELAARSGERTWLALGMAGVRRAGARSRQPGAGSRSDRRSARRGGERRRADRGLARARVSGGNRGGGWAGRARARPENAGGGGDQAAGRFVDRDERSATNLSRSA